MWLCKVSGSRYVSLSLLLAWPFCNRFSQERTWWALIALLSFPLLCAWFVISTWNSYLHATMTRDFCSSRCVQNVMALLAKVHHIQAVMWDHLLIDDSPELRILNLLPWDSSLHWGCRFVLLNMSFNLQNISSFKRSHLPILDLRAWAIGVLCRNFSPVPMSSRLSHFLFN